MTKRVFGAKDGDELPVGAVGGAIEPSAGMSEKKRHSSVSKTWNGGGIEAALELARERVESLIASGQAVRCDECNGEGGNIHSICIQCRGAGTLPPSRRAAFTRAPRVKE